MLRSALFAAALAASAACGVRAPAPLDVAALVRASGPVEARGVLEVRTLDDPSDIQARLALAKLAEETGRPAQALEQLEAVLRIGGPIGTRWHGDDRARFGRLLAARGRARLARGSVTALADLRRAREVGATIATGDMHRAQLAVAIAALRHVDAAERARGQAMLVELLATPIADPMWLGAKPKPVPRDRGLYGVWLWNLGARRAAWEALASWRAITAERDSPINATYLDAFAWWHPLDAPPPPPEHLTGPGRCRFMACEPGEAPPAARPAPRVVPPVVEGYPYDAAVVAYVRGRHADRPASVARIVAAYRRDPDIADRLARDLVAESVDAASAYATLGTLFDALIDPQRARVAWEGAVASSTEPAYVHGLALALARAGDPDAAMIHATTSAAASGDPAVAWLEVARALDGVRSHVHAMEAARYAIELAGADTIAEALEVGAAISDALGRTEQAARLRARRATVAAPAPNASAAALAAHREAPTATTVARLWVASRTETHDVPVRAALLAALDARDARRDVIVRELVALASDRDATRARAAVTALR